jgi:hypothetical protein
MMFSSFRDFLPGSFSKFWGGSDAVKRQKSAHNKTHVSIGPGTRAVLATSTHDNSVDPNGGIWQAKHKIGSGKAI